jgi:phytoene dehydrogenase-like protein
VGGELLSSIAMPFLERDVLPGYVAWLPDRKVTLHRHPDLWFEERLRALGDTSAHRDLWALFDRIARAFWDASRLGVKLPIQTPAEAFDAVRVLGLSNLPLVRYLRWTMGDALSAYGLDEDKPLRGLLSMLVEDTVHATLDRAPLVNGVLGASIRGAGLTRSRGGMAGFFRRFVAHYRHLGGHLRVGTTVKTLRGRRGDFTIETTRGPFRAGQVVCAIPAQLTARIGPPEIGEALRTFLQRDEKDMGGAIVVFLGVPETDVEAHAFTHHQVLERYDAPLGNANNMFISVSSSGDLESAPLGHRAVMLSTHCELTPWQGLTKEDYQISKQAAGERLLSVARRVYPNLARAPAIHEVATPCTFKRFTRRPRGAVGGVRLSLTNSNQRAIPHTLGFPGFWLCGDTTWPGLGTVACVLGSRIVAKAVLRASSGCIEWSALSTRTSSARP